MSDPGDGPPPSKAGPGPNPPAPSKPAPRTPKVPYRQVPSKAPGSKAPASKAPDSKAPDSGGTGSKAGGATRTPGSQGSAPQGKGAKVTVTVADDRLGDVEAVAEQLRAEGMTVDQVLGDVGIITGSVPDDQKASIGGIEGVAAVEEAISYQLPPPESEVQ